VQAYNLTNSPHFGQPNGDLGGYNTTDCTAPGPGCVDTGGGSLKTLVANPNQQFGQITGTIPNSYRQVELGLRVTF